MLAAINYLKIQKVTALLILAAVLVISVGGFVLKNRFMQGQGTVEMLEEVELSFDPEGLYALIYPRKDGNALNLNIKRVSRYDAFSYSLAYTDTEGISRGVGDENTWVNIEKGKTEYNQEILFGTCSKNVCKYDKGVENGTLTLRMKKGSKVYRINSQWHLQKPDVALGKLSSGDSHLMYNINPAEDLSLMKFTIINDLTGAPKLPNDKSVVGKVYAINVPIAKTLPGGTLSVELSDKITDQKIYRFNEFENKWDELDTKLNGSRLEAKSPGGGIFAVFSPKAG